MFRNFITCHFADAFVRECSLLELTPERRTEVNRCARNMLIHFHRAVRTEAAPERCKALFVALSYLHDCKEMLASWKELPHDLMCRYEVLEGRMADLMLQASAGENGQLRMFG